VISARKSNRREGVRRLEVALAEGGHRARIPRARTEPDVAEPVGELRREQTGLVRVWKAPERAGEQCLDVRFGAVPNTRQRL